MAYQHATTVIGSVTVDAIKSDTGIYTLSLTSLAELCGKSKQQVADFFQSAYFKKRKGANFTPPVVTMKYQGSNQTQNFSLIPLEYATEFIFYWAIRRQDLQPLALTLMSESLETRCMGAFSDIDAESIRNLQERNNALLKDKERAMAKKEHSAFQNACKIHKHNAAQVHDKLTLMVFGHKAEDARLIDYDNTGKLWEDSSVGINHHRSTVTEDEYNLYRLVKLNFSSYLKGDADFKLERAYREALADNLK